jgi:hypothetical protein
MKVSPPTLAEGHSSSFRMRSFVNLFNKTCKRYNSHNVPWMLFYPVTMGGPVPESKALPGFLLRIFSSLACLKKPVFSKRIFCSGSYQPGCTGIFWPAEGTTGLSLFLKSEKFPALLYAGKGPEYRPFMIWTCSLGLLASSIDLKSHEGPVLRPFSYT